MFDNTLHEMSINIRGKALGPGGSMAALVLLELTFIALQCNVRVEIKTLRHPSLGEIYARLQDVCAWRYPVENQFSSLR